ncbi:MAG: HEAT repeat domain-containing protein [Candidatus Heimdallarchaeota archaeon]|nr:HEAT repeat domain-containing protein [Candidatus Heimdallarchaeota archaeon]
MSKEEKEPTFEELLEQLKDDNWEVREKAIVSIKDKRAFKALWNALSEEENPNVNRFILDTLRKYNGFTKDLWKES